MEKPGEKIESLGDLEPQAAEAQDVAERDADAVRGGLTNRKAGKEQHEYLKVTMSDVLVTNVTTTTTTT